eukprot:TRINITY_DN6228_c0_g1_i15.p1 TRINITY_DN6228_c0_g1~~TRINITY_DN6228_c0_g1_i15.p1  ORF type:complete len:198 (+),score=14.63 TRINITY_DN6228_c0_g1_i15:5-598(+)
MISLKLNNVIRRLNKLREARLHTTNDLPFEEMNLGGDITLIPKHCVHESTLIWLHGENESGKRYASWFNCENSIVPQSTKVVLPSAPERRFGTSLMNVWYNPRITSSAYGDELLIWSWNYIAKIIKSEAKLLNNLHDRIFLGGFSQGCSLALWVYLKYKAAFGGFCGFSGYLFPLSLIHICRCRRYAVCRSRWSPYH